MRRIGNDQETGEVYASVGNYWRIILPTPIVTGAILEPVLSIEKPPINDAKWHMFREDHFDPTARIRRGRFYTPAPGERPAVQRVLPRLAGDTIEGAFERRLFVYDEYYPWPAGRLPKQVGLGTSDSFSLWQVVLSPERISTGEYLFTLKARHGFGILPEIDPTSIPERGREKVVETLEKLTDAAHRESPGSVIDRARDAAQWCLATWSTAKFGDDSLLTEELGRLITKIRGKNREMVALKAAEIVRRLHSRGKPNEQERHGVRPPMEDDSELAVRALAFILRELGWASG